MSTYESFSRTEDGRRRLAKSRLRYRVLGALERALTDAGITKVELARRVGVRKSAVSQVFGGDGNLRVNTIAEYLDALDSELEIRVVPTGTARSRVSGEPATPRLVFSDGKPLASIREAGRVRPDAVRPALPKWAPAKVANG